MRAIRSGVRRGGRIDQAHGQFPAGGFTASKILWLKEHEPKHFKALHTILLPHDYINFYLTGEPAMEYGDASGTGLLDVRTKEWCKPMLEFIDERGGGMSPAARGAAAGRSAC